MMLSGQSYQAITDVGNVQLIFLKKSKVPCPVCPHHVLHGTLVWSCGKHIRCNQEKIDRIVKSLIFSRHLSLVHLVQIRDVPSMDIYRGNKSKTKAMMCSELLQGRRTEHWRIFETVGKTITNTENPIKPKVGTMSVYDISSTSCRLTSVTVHLLNNEAGTTMRQFARHGRKHGRNAVDFKEVDTKKRPTPISEVQRQSRRHVNIVQVGVNEEAVGWKNASSNSPVFGIAEADLGAVLHRRTQILTSSFLSGVIKKNKPEGS